MGMKEQKARIDQMTKEEMAKALAATVLRAKKIGIPCDQVITAFTKSLATPAWHQWVRDIYAGKLV